MPLHQGPQHELLPVQFTIDQESAIPTVYDGWSDGSIVNSWDVVYVTRHTLLTLAVEWALADYPAEMPVDLLQRLAKTDKFSLDGAPLYDLVDYTTTIFDPVGSDAEVAAMAAVEAALAPLSSDQQKRAQAHQEPAEKVSDMALCTHGAIELQPGSGARCAVCGALATFPPTELPAPKPRKIDPNSARWDRLAGDVARGHVGNIYPCHKCGYPVVDGYVCESCGTSSPKTTEAEDRALEAKYAPRRSGT